MGTAQLRFLPAFVDRDHDTCLALAHLRDFRILAQDHTFCGERLQQPAGELAIVARHRLLVLDAGDT